MAVLSVVLCHLQLGLRGGFVGVDVFFVISGFLITRIIYTELETSRFSLLGFWERRVRRLVPALAVVSLAAAVGGWFFLLPQAYADFGKSLTAVWLMGANLHFWRGSGYFTATDEARPLLHTWSLAVEEQFYLVVPLLLLLLARGRHLKRAPLLLGGLALLALWISIKSVSLGRNAPFYLLHFRAWELFAGALLALLGPRIPVPGRPLREACSLLGLALILAPCVLYYEHTPFPGAAALPPVLGSVLLIWSGTAAPLPLVNRWLSWGPMVCIGLWSYSIYLWHWPLWVWLRSYTIFPPPLLLQLALLPVVIGAGYASYRWVETPFRRRTLLSGRSSLFLAGSGAAVLLVACGALIRGGHGFPSRVPAGINEVEKRAAVAAPYLLDLSPRQIPQGLRGFGAPDAAPQVLVWGDSHAMCWLPAVEALCRQASTRALAATHRATAPLMGHPDPTKRRFNEAVLAYVRRSRIPRVVLAARWGYTEGTARGLPPLVAAIRQAGSEVFVVADVPDYPFEVPWGMAMARFWKRDPRSIALTLGQYRARNAGFLSVVPELERLGARVLDPLPSLQAHTGGPNLVPFDSEGPLYTDGHHMNVRGALAIRDALAPVVAGLAAEATPGSP